MINLFSSLNVIFVKFFFTNKNLIYLFPVKTFCFLLISFRLCFVVRQLLVFNNNSLHFLQQMFIIFFTTLKIFLQQHFSFFYNNICMNYQTRGRLKKQTRKFCKKRDEIRTASRIRPNSRSFR